MEKSKARIVKLWLEFLAKRLDHPIQPKTQESDMVVRIFRKHLEWFTYEEIDMSFRNHVANKNTFPVVSDIYMFCVKSRPYSFKTYHHEAVAV